WVTPADLSGYQQVYISTGQRSLSAKGLQSCSATLVPKGTVMSSRAPIGYIAIAANPLSTNQGFKSFVCPEDVMLWPLIQIANSQSRATPDVFHRDVQVS